MDLTPIMPRHVMFSGWSWLTQLNGNTVTDKEQRQEKEKEKEREVKQGQVDEVEGGPVVGSTCCPTTTWCSSPVVSASTRNDHRMKHQWKRSAGVLCKNI